MIINEVLKNVKLIVRNWSSLLLLILGPLAIIFIIAITFSGSTLSNITVGVHSDDPSSIAAIQTIIADNGQVLRYSSIASCMQDLRAQDIHLCIDMSSDIT